MTAVRISLVVPVFNEESSIEQMLERVFAQDEYVHEVIVCNNNSNDRTGEILGRMAAVHPKLRVLDVPEQGIVPARNAGYDAATGDVIARTDADSLIEPDWFQVLAEYFATAPSDVGAVTGPLVHFDMPRHRFDPFTRGYKDTPEERRTLEPHPFTTVVGPNMALRRETWSAVRDLISSRPDVWEDVDLGCAVQESGWQIMFLPSLAAQVSGRRLLVPPIEYWKYANLVVRTVRTRGRRDLLAAAYLHVAISLLNYSIRFVPARIWDPQTNSYDWKRLAADRVARPIP